MLRNQVMIPGLVFFPPLFSFLPRTTTDFKFTFIILTVITMVWLPSAHQSGKVSFAFVFIHQNE